MLKTEMRNPRSMHIDRMSTYEMAKVMSDENFNAAKAVEEALPSIVLAIDAVTESMTRGGRLFYIGAGTSGRLGVLDASECPPTFGVDPSLVTGIIAGGYECLVAASENAEDKAQNGRADVEKAGFRAGDVIVGISVAGGAAYVIGALEAAKELGGTTVALTSNAGSPITEKADITIVTDTGAEVITGSSRMKAGSAHKMVLNMISTSAMIKTGRVYENMMINLRPSNLKLRRRVINILCEICSITEAESEKLLEENEWNIRRAAEAYGAKK